MAFGRGQTLPKLHAAMTQLLGDSIERSPTAWKQSRVEMRQGDV